MNEIKKINEAYDILSDLKRDFIKDFMSEAVFANPVPIPSGFKGNFGEKRKNEVHPGTDIPVPSGTEIKAPADGVIVAAIANQHPCGGTLDIDYGNGFWSRFCHVKRIDVKNGDKVSQGQVVGLTGGGSNDFGKGNSGGPHLHFTLKKDGQRVDPIQYMGKFNLGNQKLSDIKPSTDTSTDDDDNDDDTETTSGNIETEFIKKLVAPLAAAVTKGLTEEKIYSKIGNKVSNRFGSIIIPSNGNDKIKSPIDGVINNLRYNSSCVNKISIEHSIDGKLYYLQFCGISKPNVKDGRRVSKGDIIGNTSSDVSVSLYDKGLNKVNLPAMLDKNVSTNTSSNKEQGKENNQSNDSSNDSSKKREYYDPIYASIGKKILDIGKKIQDKIPSTTKGGEPKIKNFFNKYGMTTKKVDENIERIKTLLK
jgi:murein DD-endopeptidase MepM/ murein hydrolase activator NlpD